MNKILLFSTEYCNPCKQIKDWIKDYKYPNVTIDIIDCESDEGDDLTQTYGIRSVPTLLFLDTDKELFRYVGTMTKSNLDSLCKRYYNDDDLLLNSERGLTT